MTDTKSPITVDGTVQCLAELRWVPFSIQNQKLQQLWEIVEYKDGKPYRARREWRDVPSVGVTEAAGK